MLSAADVELEQPPASEDDPVSETAAGVENVVERPVAPKSALRKGGGSKPEGLHASFKRLQAGGTACGDGETRGEDVRGGPDDAVDDGAGGSASGSGGVGHGASKEEMVAVPDSCVRVRETASVDPSAAEEAGRR